MSDTVQLSVHAFRAGRDEGRCDYVSSDDERCPDDAYAFLDFDASSLCIYVCRRHAPGPVEAALGDC